MNIQRHLLTESEIRNIPVYSIYSKSLRYLSFPCIKSLYCIKEEQHPSLMQYLPCVMSEFSSNSAPHGSFVARCVPKSIVAQFEFSFFFISFCTEAHCCYARQKTGFTSIFFNTLD